MSIPLVLTDHRTENYWVELLDENDKIKRTLTEFQGGSIEQNVNRAVRGGGSVNLTIHGDFDIDWGKDRFRVWYETWTNTTIAEHLTWPLGVFLIEAPEVTRDDDDGSRSVSVKIMDKLSVPEQDAVDGSFSLPAGANIVAAARDLLLSTGETNLAVTDSDTLLPAGKMWEAGTAKLAIINDLLTMVNYWALHLDGYGQFQMQPYVEPDARPAVYAFTTGEASIYAPQWKRTQEWFDTPNKVVLVSQSSQDAPALVGIAVNEDPTSPYSIPARGRTIVLTETGADAATQADIDALAKRRLADATTAVTNLTVEHAPVNLALNDRVDFNAPDYQVYATVRSWTLNLSVGSLMAASWRELGAILTTPEVPEVGEDGPLALPGAMAMRGVPA